MICVRCGATLSPEMESCLACGTAVTSPPELTGLHLPPPSADDRVLVPPSGFAVPVEEAVPAPLPVDSTPPLPPPPPPPPAPDSRSSAYSSAPPPAPGSRPVNPEGSAPWVPSADAGESSWARDDTDVRPEPPVWPSSDVPFDSEESEPSTVWSIPEVFNETDRDSAARFSTTIPHEEANRLVAEALRQAAAAAAEAEASQGAWGPGVSGGAGVAGSASAAGGPTEQQNVWPENGFDSHRPPSFSAEQIVQSWQLLLPDGSSLRFGRRALVGRQAVADERWPDAELVTIADPTLSMSKNHVRLETDELGVVVIDLFSLNGTVVTTDDGTAIDLYDGQRTRLTSGARITLGDFDVRLERV